MDELDALFDAQGNVATTGQLRRIFTRRGLEAKANTGEFVKVWSGVYGRGQVDDLLRLRGLDLRAGVPVPICLGTAARAYGFDTEDGADLQVLNPPHGQLRNADGRSSRAGPRPRRRGRPLRWPGGCGVRAPWPLWMPRCGAVPAIAGLYSSLPRRSRGGAES
jgi:hypothetical protein